MNIKAIYKEIETELQMVSDKSKQISLSQYSLIAAVFSHIIANGKKVRPALVILIAKAFGVQNTNGVVNSAFAVELIHTASLLHDDVVDKTTKRRGKKTANILWGNKEVILVGDHLFTQAFLAVAEMKNHDAIAIIANASHNLTVGEIVQLKNEGNVKITIAEYLNTIYNKTASLFEASAGLGAIFSANCEKLEKCKEFGKNIGMAFQIMDDILDYTGNTALNKNIGTDFKERKLTLPVIMLLESAEKLEQKAIVGYFSGTDEMKISAILALFEKYSIIKKCNNTMHEYIDLAQNFVKSEIKEETMQKLFKEFLNFFTERRF